MSSQSQELVPAGSHTLVIDEPDTTRAIMLMDSHDVEQAMAELRGEVLATFVYRPPKARPQLTYAGVKEAARLYRNVHFGATAVPLPDGTWMITSYAHNLADNTRVDYPMPYPAFNPANPDEAIKFRANLSKSLRNALAAVLPVAYLQTMIERWLEQGNEGRGTGQQAARLADRPVPARGAGLRVADTVTVAVPALAVDPHAALRAEVAGLLRADTEAAGKLPKGADAMNEEELGKTRVWLMTRAARVRAAARQAAEEADEDADAPEPHAARRTPNADEWPRSAADWTRAQLRQRIQEGAGVALKSGKEWKALAQAHGQPDVASSAEMTQGWLLGLYQAMRAREYAEMIAHVSAEQAVTEFVSAALSERDTRQITAQQYSALCAAGEARKAELSGPLLRGAGAQGPAQVAS